MTKNNKTYCLVAALALLSVPFTANSVAANTNLKTSTGQKVGSMQTKFYGEKKPTYSYKRVAKVMSKWPNDWKWKNGIDPDKPLFNQLDENTNGAISKREFRAAVINDKEEEVFAALDKNSNKSISRSELEEFAKN